MSEDINSVDYKIKVMEAYKDGYAIEFQDPEDNAWKQVDKPTWNWYIYDYRIAPGPTLMTNLQLAEWIARGNGYAVDNLGAVMTTHMFSERKRNTLVNVKFVDVKYICHWGKDEKLNPTVDVYNNDCLSNTSTYANED